MSRRRVAEGGSRYLYEPFEFASVQHVEAQERVIEAKLGAIERHFERLESAVDRLERRLWATLSGVAAMVLAEVLRAVMEFGPGG